MPVGHVVGAEGIATLEADAAVTIETFGSRFRRLGERFVGDLELRTAEQAKAVAALKGVLMAMVRDPSRAGCRACARASAA